MDLGLIEQLGIGGGAGGAVVAVIVLLGWQRRLNKLEDEKVDKTTCKIAHSSQEKIIQGMCEDLKYIRDRVDTFLNHRSEK